MGGGGTGPNMTGIFVTRIYILAHAKLNMSKQCYAMTKNGKCCLVVGIILKREVIVPLFCALIAILDPFLDITQCQQGH